MFSRSSNLAFELAFLKMWYFNFFEKIYCARAYMAMERIEHGKMALLTSRTV
jgi:hypothetical protein